MFYTDIFIKRPVLASVISLMILLLGLRSLYSLQVRQFPVSQNATITVTTAYPGANPEVVAGFITTPLEAAVAQAQGIDYISSKSSSGLSTITAVLRLNYDSNRALNEINTKISSVRNQLPAAAQQPQVAVSNGDETASMYLSFNSDVLASNQITDYLTRVVQPKLQTIAGVQSASILGGRQFALRAWLDPARMTAMGLTAQDIYQALASNHYVSAVGQTRGDMVQVNLSAGTDLHTLEEFRELVVKQNGTSSVKLQDVANVTMGAESYDFNISFDGQQAVFFGIYVAPDANLLEVAAKVRDAFPEIQKQLPSGMSGQVVYDATKFVRSSIKEVVKTLIEALLIVTLVIFLFLGNVRAVIIPTLAMPLSLIGAFFIMLVFGYTVNLLTLLALVLAIGLVVDDAIIVVENVDRHLKEGLSPMQASIQAARELANPIIAISVVLIAVYVPIGFQGGLTGTLFTEFAFTLAGAVAVSAIVALTLSPMMCARMLNNKESKFQHLIDQALLRLQNSYSKLLHSALEARNVVIVFGFVIMALTLVFSKMSQSELAPEEDQGFLIMITQGPPNATIEQMGLYSGQMKQLLTDLPEREHFFIGDGAFGPPNSGFAGLVMKPWEERERSSKMIQNELQGKLNDIAGAKVFSFSPPALPGGGQGFPLQFVITTTEPYVNLVEVANAIKDKALASTKVRFYFLDNDLKIDKPQTKLLVDREKAAALGIKMSDIGNTLGAMLGGANVNYFSTAGRSYKVIPQVQQASRLTAEQLDNYSLRTSSGALVPASAIISFKTTAEPQNLSRFQQLNSATIGGVAGAPMGEALAELKRIAEETLPSGYFIDYAGQARQTIQETSGFTFTFIFAVIIIFLVLAALFESFLDPLVVMMSVPMAIFGAMVFIFEGAASLNIYTQVGLVTLVGLIAKHGILIVQFANDQQKLGMNKRQAIEMAASVRLRPILMTTAAMALGVIPLIIASGAGAVGRNNIGLVIGAGISIGTLFTLFVVPAMYLLLSKARPNQA